MIKNRAPESDPESDELLVVRFDLVHGYDLKAAMENQTTGAIFSKEVHIEGWI